jgi:hypothetical protein
LASAAPSFFIRWSSKDLYPFFYQLRKSRLLILKLLLISGIHPHPGSASPLPLPTILQLNCNGLRSSVAEIDDFLIKNRISVAAFQETKLKANSVFRKFTNYNLIRADRPGRGGGGDLRSSFTTLSLSLPSLLLLYMT